MTPERWQRIKQVFDSAAALEPLERQQYLEQACAGDVELRAEVETLLESEDRDLTLLDGGVFHAFDRMLRREAGDAGRRLGSYRIGREIGRGGMAAVFAAVRADEQYRQEVAVKLIRRGMDTDRMIARFRQERQILANLVHPNIARLLDGGVTDDGLPYLVMELIDGVPIDVYCDRHQLSIVQRLELFRTVCAAVQYAHRNLVVHRDLKPSNILVTREGVPKLLDFGIAKLLEPGLDGASAEGALPVELTIDGPRPMTPSYASPEQVLGRPVITASDVYALGVLLYRLLSGRRPYRIEQLSRREIERVICDQTPERPSAVAREALETDAESAQELARLRATTPEQLRRLLRGDLDNIVMMALRKDPERRYGSAEQLSEDLRRHLERLPVIARDDTLAYRAGKFVRRHRFGVVAAALIFFSLVGGIAAATWQARVARTERLTAQTVSEFLVDLFEPTDPETARGADVTARELLQRSVTKIDLLADRPVVQAALMDTIGLLYLKLGLRDDAEPLLENALELRRRHLAPDDPSLADSLANVGELRVAWARFEDAETLHRRALALRRLKLGEEDPRLAESENDLALVLFHRGRPDEAEELLRRALDRQQLALGEEHQEVAETLNNLAFVLRRKGRFAEARDLYQRSLEMSQELLGEDHPQVARQLNNLALVQCAEGAHEAALELYDQAEALYLKVLGEEYPELATTRANRANCLLSMGDVEGARRLWDSVLELRRAILGNDHPSVAGTLNNLAELLYDRGELRVAERYLQEALDIYRRLSGGLHPDAAVTLNNLAAALQRRGELAEAEELYREALDLNRKVFGTTHRQIALNLNNLAVLLVARDDREAAVGYYREAIAMYRQLFGEEHLSVSRTQYRLAQALLGLGRPAEAEAEFRASAALRRKLLGDSSPEGRSRLHRDLARSVRGLGRALMDQGRPGEAEPHLREAMMIWLEQSARRQPGLALSQCTLGWALTALERYPEAESLLIESHDFLNERYGADHRWSQEASRWLAELARKREQTSSAERAD